MREETVTQSVIRFLESRDWRIISYDYPGSGTGLALKPDRARDPGSKNLEALIPDTIASKGGEGLFSENKDRFDPADVDKLDLLRGGKYSRSVRALFQKQPNKFLFGVAFPWSERDIQKASEHFHRVDFVMWVRADGTCAVVWPGETFFGR